MFKKQIKEFLILLGIIVLAVATAVLAITEVRGTGTISGLTLIPILAGLVWFGGSMMVKDIKSFKKLYEMTDDE